jgi:predicted alpha/beta superfamily hydrolase
MYTALSYPNIFSRLMIMSPSVWWSNNWILYSMNQNINDSLSTTLKPANTRIWLDVGDAEGKETVEEIRAMKMLLTTKGWKLGSNLAYTEAKNAPHSESAWSERLESAWTFLWKNTRK